MPQFEKEKKKDFGRWTSFIPIIGRRGNNKKNVENILQLEMIWS